MLEEDEKQSSENSQKDDVKRRSKKLEYEIYFQSLRRQLNQALESNEDQPQKQNAYKKPQFLKAKTFTKQKDINLLNQDIKVISEENIQTNIDTCKRQGDHPQNFSSVSTIRQNTGHYTTPSEKTEIQQHEGSQELHTEYSDSEEYEEEITLKVNVKPVKTKNEEEEKQQDMEILQNKNLQKLRVKQQVSIPPIQEAIEEDSQPLNSQIKPLLTLNNNTNLFVEKIKESQYNNVVNIQKGPIKENEQKEEEKDPQIQTQQNAPRTFLKKLD